MKLFTCSRIVRFETAALHVVLDYPEAAGASWIKEPSVTTVHNVNGNENHGHITKTFFLFALVSTY